jgi:hypothetical protein
MLSGRCRGLLDEGNDGLGLGDVHGVAAGDFGDGGAGTFGHGASGTILSSATTRYQLGWARQAASVMVPTRASAPQGTWESAMNAAWAAAGRRRTRRGTCPGPRNRNPSAGRPGSAAEGPSAGNPASMLLTDSPADTRSDLPAESERSGRRIGEPFCTTRSTHSARSLPVAADGRLSRERGSDVLFSQE